MSTPPREAASSKAGAAPEHKPLPGVRFSGWFVKEGRVRKSWKLRFFTVAAGRVTYAASEGAAEKGGLHVLDAWCEADRDTGAQGSSSGPVPFSGESGAPADASGREYSHRFSLTDAAGRTLRLAAHSAESRDSFIAEVRDAAACEGYLSVCHRRGARPLPAVSGTMARRDSTLCVDGVALCPEQVEALCVLLAQATSLRHVSLRGCSLDDDASASLLAALGAGNTVSATGTPAGPPGGGKYECKIVSITLANNRGGARASHGMAMALNACHSLRSVSLAGNAIGCNGAMQVADALMSTIAESVDLTSCEIGSEGCAALGGALVVNSSVKVLRLDKNPIGDAGAASIAQAVSTSQSLREISVEMCGLGHQGCEDIAVAIASSASVERVGLAGNTVGPSAMAAIASALANPGNKLRGATLGSETLDGSVFREIAPALAAGTGLTAQKLVMVRR